MSKKKMLMRKFGSITIVNNTFIGGVASVINTPALLAAKLRNYPSGTTFDAANIQNFTIVGDDIECYIGVEHSISFQIAVNLLTYYYGFENKCKELKDGVFMQNKANAIIEITDVIRIYNSVFSYGYTTKFILKNCLNFSFKAFWDMYGGSSGYRNPEIIYIPRATNLGGNALEESVFYLSRVNNTTTIYANPFLETSNAGAEEGDLAYARSLGATIIYVQNFTAPNPITNLSIGEVYGTALQVLFTAPTGSTNAIESYEVYVNGRYNKKITGSGEYITGLAPNTTYNIEVKPVDIYYNKSTSNIVTQATNSTYYVDTASLISYYKMEGNVLDSWGSNHGTATAITYASGLVGQGVVSNGSTSQIGLGMIPDLIYDSSIVFMIKQTSRPSKCNPFEYGSYTSWGSLNIITDGTLYFYHTPYSGGSFLYPSTAPYTIPLNTWTIVTLVRDYTNGVIQIYFNTTLVMNFATTETRAKDPSSQALFLKGYAGTLNGMMDEPMAFNKALSAGEVSDISTKLNSGQSLI